VSLFAQSVPLMSKMLTNLLAWLEQARAYADERGFEADVLVGARLYPDQFALVRQIQAACDAAKLAAARLAGVEAPKHPDEETTLDQLEARVRDVVGYLETFDEAKLEGAADREIELPMLPEGTYVIGRDYLHDFALPNFFFHVGHAYAILRHNGVPLGKRAWLGSLSLRQR